MRKQKRVHPPGTSRRLVSAWRLRLYEATGYRSAEALATAIMRSPERSVILELLKKEKCSDAKI